MSLWRTVAIAVVVLSAAPLFGQAAGGGGGGGGGGRGGRFDPAQMRQQMEQRLKEQLGTTDDEWKVLQPKIDRVMQAQRDAMGGRGFRRNRGRNGQNDPNQPTPPPATPVQQKAEALQKLLDDKNSKPEDIKAALSALREARAQAKADLAKAQDDLRQFLTARQESVLVVDGMLD